MLYTIEKQPTPDCTKLPLRFWARVRLSGLFGLTSIYAHNSAIFRANYLNINDIVVKCRSLQVYLASVNQIDHP